jgi:hypothetical protein
VLGVSLIELVIPIYIVQIAPMHDKQERYSLIHSKAFAVVLLAFEAKPANALAHGSVQP